MQMNVDVQQVLIQNSFVLFEHATSRTVLSSSSLFYHFKNKIMKNYSQAIERLHSESKKIRNAYLCESDHSRATQLCKKRSEKIEKLLLLEKEQCNEFLSFQ